jgi:hypothetical protein
MLLETGTWGNFMPIISAAETHQLLFHFVIRFTMGKVAEILSDSGSK